ncbi:MAG TPA: hypothetical protein VHC22_17870 [Pirellulales bacterium]|nr:hypothetical protein [Pirellulales bacterium]
MRLDGFDVCTLANPANPIKHGTSKQSTQINGVDMQTNSDYVRSNPEGQADITARFTDKYDDETYYTS